MRARLKNIVCLAYDSESSAEARRTVMDMIPTDVASQPCRIPLPGALTLALRIILLSLASRPTGKERCNVEYSPIAFYPRLRRFSSGVAPHGVHRRGIQVDRFCDAHARDDLGVVLAAVRNIRPGCGGHRDSHVLF